MRSKAYWVRRTDALERAMQDNARIASENIIRAYERAIVNINSDIRDIFKTYAASSQLSKKDAKQLLNSSEHDKTYQELLQLYQNTVNPRARTDIMNRINAQAYGARMSRLEGVKARIYTHLANATIFSERTQKTLYTDTLQSSYYTNIYNIAKGINAGIDFTVLPQHAIDRVLSEPWFGGNYSSRIWKHNDEFVETLQNTLESGIIEGHSVSRMSEQMLDFVNDGVNSIRMNTERLVRSETSHFMNQGQLAAYEDIGIEKYQFVAALGERTCDICGNLDGETFEVAEAIEGENYPPMHAQCRCCTIIASEPPITRNAKDPLTGEDYKVDGSMTFAEWKNSLTGEQKQALKYVDKSAGSDIINIRGGKIMSINSIDSPIEQRNTGKGNPSGIVHIGRPLNNRQQRLLEKLPEYDSKITVQKNNVNMKDLAALTAHTGDEFALFTKGHERLIIRGDSRSVNVDLETAKELSRQGYRWSGHTHPGISADFATPSQGDRDILECFNQKTSVIYNSLGKYRTFEKE